MTNESKINQLLQPLHDFMQSLHSPYRMGAVADPLFRTYTKLLSRMQEPRELWVEEAHSYDDDLYWALGSLLNCYLMDDLPNRLSELPALLQGTTADKLGLPLMHEMAKGWPASIRSVYRLFPPQFIRSETEV